MSRPMLKPKAVPIINDYKITDVVLGLGINGKVVECWDKKTGDKYALKVIRTFIPCLFNSSIFNSIQFINIKFSLIFIIQYVN